jgi:hypothetical protein
VLEHIHNIGSKLLEGVQDLIDVHGLCNEILVSGYPGRHIMEFFCDGEIDLIAKTYFQQESIERGILAAAWHAPSYGHTELDVSTTLDVYDDVLKLLKLGLETESLPTLLKGNIVDPVFRKP